MFLQNLRAKVGARLNGDKEAGFTLIELLVVMLILGILAAIALPAFFNQKDKAGDAKAKEYAHSAQVAMETCNVDKGGTYTGCVDTELEAIEPSLTNAELTVSGPGTETAPNDDGYTVSVEGTSGAFEIENDKGALTFSCEGGSDGGCKEGSWGE